MTDIVDKKTRSRMMAGIRGKNTKPEMIIRKGLHARGLRFRLHDKRLPGKPDLYFPRYNAVVEVRGCFWHRHQCALFKWPSTREEYWREKLDHNAVRDQQNLYQLAQDGIRCCVVWECSLKSTGHEEIELLLDSVANWINSSQEYAEFPAPDQFV